MKSEICPYANKRVIDCIDCDKTYDSFAECEVEGEMKFDDDLIGHENAGFEIIKQGDVAVIGHRKSDDQYVAWHYHFEPSGKPSFYWGRYGFQDYAEECFSKKENGIYSGSGNI